MKYGQRDAFTASVAEKLFFFKHSLGHDELSFQARMTLKELLEHSLDEECTIQLGVGRYRRSRQRRDQRNGFYRRNLDTELGSVDGLRVPRSRHGTYEPQVFQRYQRRTPEVNEAICRLFLRGVSTREVGDILELLTGTGVSATTVSQVTKALDTRVRAFHQRPLADQYQYLILDGIHLRRKSASGSRKQPVLVAYGIRYDGRRELIDFALADSESEADWTSFLHSLYGRGLHGERLQLISTDGAAGLLLALAMVYPTVPHQRCWRHKLQNVANKLRRVHRDVFLAQAKHIYLAPTRREATRVWRALKAQWHQLEPKAVASLEQDMEALLRCFDLPPEHRSKVRITNPIERSFREVRRRTNPMSCFNDTSSIQRIVYALVFHMNQRWELKPLKHFTQKT